MMIAISESKYDTNLVSKHWVKLIEDIFREASTFNSDGSSSFTNGAGRNFRYNWARNS